MSYPDDDNHDEKKLSTDEIEITVIHEHVSHEEGGGVTGGALAGGGDPGDGTSVGSTDGPSFGESLGGPSPTTETTNYTAMCEERHPPPLGPQYIGPVRKGANAYQDAKKDADEHNRKNPGHKAAAVAG